jgi:hypothetical protein
MSQPRSAWEPDPTAATAAPPAGAPAPDGDAPVAAVAQLVVPRFSRRDRRVELELDERLEGRLDTERGKEREPTGLREGERNRRRCDGAEVAGGRLPAQ